MFITRSSPSRSAGSANDFDVVHRTAWAVVFALLFGMLFPVVLLRGMSLDGITYATIARNMAFGLGDLWHPFYTSTLYDSFHEQPPLAMLLESWFFRLWGDQWWVERLYSVLTTLPTAALMVLIWRRLTVNEPRWQSYAWLAVALWILMPSWFWIYRHNYLENTLGVFTLGAVYGSLRAMEMSRAWWVWTAVAAVSIVAAMGSKGPVGLFPAVTPALVWLTLRGPSVRKALLVQTVLIVVLVGTIGLVLADQEAREFLSIYFQEQVLSSLQGGRETVDSQWGRFHLAGALFIDLLPSGIAACMVRLAARYRCADAILSGPSGPAAFALLTALSASLPMMISPKQSAYYAAASWPFYTMTLAFWCLPAASALVSRWAASEQSAWWAWRIQAAAAAGAAIVLVTSPLWCGKVFRDHELLHDVDRIGEIVGRHGTLVAGRELRKEWSLQAYLYRRHFISLDLGPQRHAYRLELADVEHAPPSGYALEDSGLRLFRLYRSFHVAALSDGGTATP